MKIVSNMDGVPTLAQVLKLWMVLTLAVATCNPKSATAYAGLTKGKLANENSGFISIDCGATEDYKDNETGIFYESDAKYIDAGKVHEISPGFTLNRNYYKQQKLKVCLVNTNLGDPFISVLELRSLDNAAYKIENAALLTVSRYDLGVEDQSKITRYPTDLYDRLWMSFHVLNGMSTDAAMYSPSQYDGYKIPDQVLQTAVASENASLSYDLYYNKYKLRSNCYVYLHFAEIEKFEDGRQRKLRIYVNGSVVVNSLTLEYLKPVTIHPANQLASCTKFRFDIYAATGSDLPAILNACEVYATLDLPDSPTDLNDVIATMEIKQIYGVPRNWQGDPCMPRKLLWDGLSCSNENPPRITSIDLSSSKLTGEIASSISKLEKLQSLDLSNNSITGPLPDFLAQLPNLRFLNLAGNRLYGAVPSSLMEKSRSGILTLSLDENPELCLSTQCQKKKKKKMLVIPVVASITVVMAVLVILSSLAIYKKKRRAAMLGSKKESPAKSKNQPFTYSQIVRITDNFRTVIGGGGFGKVYLGTLNNGTEVAVKMLSPSSRQGYKEFQAEVKLLMIVHHVNLVSLIGYCDEPDNMALIYEYLENKDLKQHLSDKNMKVLRWNKRLEIAVDAAHGLEYLHNGCNPPIIHRDLKTSNILLNQNMQAKIADFGLSRVSENESDRIVTTRPAGTPGYLDPEFYAHGIFNKKSDVYSFGIVLLELITGKSAMVHGSRDNCHIVQWITPLIQRGDIQNIIDPRLEGVFNTNSAWKILEIAMSCVSLTAIQRPDMSQVLAELKDCLVLELPVNDSQLVYAMEMAPSSR